MGMLKLFVVHGTDEEGPRVKALTAHSVVKLLIMSSLSAPTLGVRSRLPLLVCEPPHWRYGEREREREGGVGREEG